MNMNISEQLDENIEELKKRFKDCQDVIQRKMIAAGMPIYVVRPGEFRVLSRKCRSGARRIVLPSQCGQIQY